MTFSRYRDLETYKPRFSNSWNEYRNSIEDRWGGVWWGYQVVGRFQSEEEIRNHPINNDGQNNRTQLPGDLIYKDVNGDGVINDMDQRPIGYPTGWAPMMSFGGRIGLDWKGINLNIDPPVVRCNPGFRIMSYVMPSMVGVILQLIYLKIDGIAKTLMIQTANGFRDATLRFVMATQVPIVEIVIFG
jgi:hypothetical protein